jgi:translation initiation factor IF-1
LSSGIEPGAGGADPPAPASGQPGAPDPPGAGDFGSGVNAVAADLPAELGSDTSVVDLVAAAIRADTSDLDAYHRVLSATVSDMLPAGMVEVDRERSMKDRMAGREGRATSIRIRLGDRTLELVAQRGRLVATAAREVRGVVISRQEISVAEWTQLLAQYLAQLAAENADARLALSKLLGGV